MTASFTESVVEQAALVWLESIGWQLAHGPDITPDMPAAERRDYGEVVLQARLPAGQAGEGDADGARAGRGSVRRMGSRVKGASNNSTS